MEANQHGWIANYIWGIADDVLRDLYVRGKYRDVILALIRAQRSRVLPRLLFTVLQSRYVQRQVFDSWSYGTQPNLSMGAMERLMVALPPVGEQGCLLVHIDEATSPPTEASHRAHREIRLLREYRTCLIADVVTGKLDVREAAARLPDEVEDVDEVEVVDDVDAVDDAMVDESEPATEEVDA